MMARVIEIQWHTLQFSAFYVLQGFFGLLGCLLFARKKKRLASPLSNCKVFLKTAHQLKEMALSIITALDSPC